MILVLAGVDSISEQSVDMRMLYFTLGGQVNARHTCILGPYGLGTQPILHKKKGLYTNEMIGLSTSLQMMPGGMSPTGWDLGSMWLTWVLGLLALIPIVVLIAFFLRHEEPKNVPITGFSQIQTEPIKSENTKRNEVSREQPNSAVLTAVVRSLAPTLTDDERRVMDQIVKAGGEVLQSDLPRMTDFSKATVSKAIHGLEVRAIVVREKHKWTYWCKVNPRLIEKTLQDRTGLHRQATHGLAEVQIRM